MNELQTWKQQIADARKAGDAAGVRNTLLDAFAAFGCLSTSLVSERNYAAAEVVQKEWGEMLEQAKTDLLEKQLLFSHSRYQASCGTLQELLGLQAYFLHGDFVEAPRLLEKAEVHHERSAAFAAKVAFPAEAPPEARAMQKGIVALQEAEMLRVRGMRLLVQGEFESEAGGLGRSIDLLQQAIATMEAAEARTPPAPNGDAVADVLEQGKQNLNFIDFAQALLHKTQSDAALLSGNLTEAAVHQQARAEALQRCQSMHLRAGPALHEGFARRLARDVHVAHQRHDRLAAAARQQPRWEWLKAVAFFVMAIGSVALFMWLSAKFDLLKNQAVFAFWLCFVMAVAGIGARLVAWKDAATWLRSAVPTGGGGKG
jgi:hypothetical protein